MANQRKSKEEKMKVLQTSQKYFAIMGISSEQSNQKYPMNAKILIGFIVLGYSFVAHLVYLIYIANTFDKYIECICATVAMAVITTCFLSMVFGMNLLLESIDNIEKLIETSK